MTYEMEYMAELFACGAFGKKAQPPKQPVNWEKIVRLAVEQSITYTVALAIKNSETGCPEETKQRIVASQRGAAIKNYIVTEGVLKLVGAMEAEGIPTVIIKGIDAARYYASPECRVSSDTDMLVSPENETKALKFLRSRGFKTEKRLKDELHTRCFHPELGLLELHYSILTESHMRELKGSGELNARAVSSSVMSSYNGMPYRALEPTDSMLFLTYHMVKHFLNGGICIRMLMDNALYSKNNSDRIDRARYAEELARSNCDRIAGLLFGTAVRYLGVSPDDLPIEPITDEQGTRSIMDDLEAGGWEGYLNKGGPSAWALQFYKREKALERNDREMLKDLRSDGRLMQKWALFPGKEKMRASYPVLNRHMILYPACWMHRLFSAGIPWLKRGGMRRVSVPRGNEEKLSPEARERLELYRRLELL